MAEAAEERFEYPGGLVAHQMLCTCDGGLLMRPARFHGDCGGSGYLVRWEQDGVEVSGPGGSTNG